MLINRLKLHSQITTATFTTKFPVFLYHKQLVVKNVIFNAGLYKPSGFFTQHALILSNLCNKVPIIKFQSHGKRRRRTVMAHIKLQANKIWPAVDKLTHEFYPILADYKTPKMQKNEKTNTISFRIRQKLMIHDDFEDLVSAGMYDNYRGIFLPLTVHVNFYNFNTHIFNESYLRALRLPISLYKRHPKPAFDDAIAF